MRVKQIKPLVIIHWVLASLQGSGVIKAGWHCGSQPGGSGCCEDPPDCDHCYDLTGDCPGNCELVPERTAETQTPGNCQEELCSGSEDDLSDEPECGKCEEDGPGPDSGKNGSACEDGCGECIDGGCEITDPQKPKETQTPNDCKTELCDGTTTDDAGDLPEDIPYDCKKPGCENGSLKDLSDDGDISDEDAECNDCNEGELTPKPNNTKLSGKECAFCVGGRAQDKDFLDGQPVCDICNGETCTDGNCTQEGPEDCASSCARGMCGTPCGCLGGTGGMHTTANSCWGVREPDGTYICYRDYGSTVPTRLYDPVCCGEGCDLMGNLPDVGWYLGGGGRSFQCTVAEPCSEAAFEECFPVARR